MTTSPRRMLRLASYAVTIFLVGVSIFALAEYATGTQPFYVVTDNPSSMSPTLNYGDLAVIYRVPFSSIGPGSIIAFHDPRGNPGILLHRVVSVGGCGGSACLITKGDNNATNPTADPWNVTTNDYVGEAVLVIPHLGYASPALWGFSGISALLPVSVVCVAAAAFGAIERRPEHVKEGDR